MLMAVLKNKFIVSFIKIFGTLAFPTNELTASVYVGHAPQLLLLSPRPYSSGGVIATTAAAEGGEGRK